MLPPMTARSLVILLVACSAPPKPAPAPPSPPTPPTEAKAEPEPDPSPPALRLPATVRPLRHDVELTIDPASEDFTGKIDIDVEVTAPTKVVWLNQEEIKI